MENHLELTVAKKRAREDPDWVCSENDSDCENVDVPALQQELAKLRKENLTLKKMLKQAYDGQPAAVAVAPEMSAEAIKNSAERLLKSLATSIKNQMVYKPSLKHGTSRVSVEIPNLSLPEVEALMGKDLYASASKGKKQVSVLAKEDALDQLFGCYALRKSLRYGSELYLKEGLKMIYSKETRVLKATGSCAMSR
ncbi:hypothetical protein Ndes2526B_g03906 [Nannochloris sp. 'desiccata']